MIKDCEYCAGTRIFIIHDIPFEREQTSGNIQDNVSVRGCSYCNGEGCYNDEEFMTVPRKYVKHEYFEDLKEGKQ